MQPYNVTGAVRITVQTFAFLKKRLPDGGKATLEVAPGTTIGELMALLDLPGGQVHLIFRNNVHAQAEDVLEPGDRVAFFPPVAGG